MFKFLPMKIAEYESYLNECLQTVLGIAPLRAMITQFALPTFSLAPDLMHDLILFRPFAINNHELPLASLEFQSEVATTAKLDGDHVRKLRSLDGLTETGMPDWESDIKLSHARHLDLQDAFAPFYARGIFEEAGVEITSRHGVWTKTCRKTGQLTVGEFLDLLNQHDLKPEIEAFAIDGLDQMGRVCGEVLYR